MLKVKVRWSGFIGSPGWSNFYFAGPDNSFETPEDAPIVADKVATFLNNIKLRFPGAVTWQIQSDVEAITPDTGTLNNVFSAGARPAIVGGAGAASYSGASGAVITWRTAGVRNGRRVRGRTFLVPLATSGYADDGTLGPTTLQELQDSATQLATQTAGGVNLGVWSRPSAQGAEDGDFFPITAASVPDLAAVLRSRRG